MAKCKWKESAEAEETCEEEEFYAFLPSELVLCEGHSRYSYDRFEDLNRQFIWYLELRKKFGDD